VKWNPRCKAGVEDEGRPLGIGFPEQVSNQPGLLRCR
jgi:hypothetical protein